MHRSALPRAMAIVILQTVLFGCSGGDDKGDPDVIDVDGDGVPAADDCDDHRLPLTVLS